MKQWFYADGNRQRQGPLEQDALVALFHRQQVGLDTLVWSQGMAQWQPLRDFVSELDLMASPVAVTPPAPPAPPLAAVVAAPARAEVETDVAVLEPAPVAEPLAVADAPISGRAVFTARDPSYQPEPARVVERSPASPYAPPTAHVEDNHGPVHAGHVVYAGFWKRVAASIIDSFAIGIPVGVIVAIIGGLLGNGFGSFNRGYDPTTTLLSYLLAAAAFGWFHSAAGMMATPGKLAVGIKVVRGDGDKITFLRGFGRYFAYLLSSLLLCIGLVMAAFTQRKQALHDLICDTVVVDKWAFTRSPERQREELGTVTIVVLVIGGLLLIGAGLMFGVIIAAIAGGGLR